MSILINYQLVIDKRSVTCEFLTVAPYVQLGSPLVQRAALRGSASALALLMLGNFRLKRPGRRGHYRAPPTRPLYWG